jgi:DNA-binding MarR family transcriptional regulator
LTLIQASRNRGKGDFPTHLELSQTDMSDMLGVTRQSFNSSLKRLESMELIQVAHMQITVIDLAKLRGYVASGGV